MKKERLGSSAKKRDVKQASSRPTELYHSCSQLPLNIFIDCIIDGNLNGLVIRGSIDKEVLASAWLNIYYEYISINHSSETEYIHKLQVDVSLLNDEIQNVETCLLYLSPEYINLCNGRHEEVIDLLKYYGYRQTIDINTDYSKVLIGIQNQLAPKKMRRDGKAKELDEYIKAKSKDKVTRSHFDSILIRLSRFQGYHVRAKDVTVVEYIMLLKDYIKSFERPEDAKDVS